MLRTVIIMLVAMNDRRNDDHRQIDGSTNAPQVPPIRPSTQVLSYPPPYYVVHRPPPPPYQTKWTQFVSLTYRSIFPPNPTETQLECISSHGTTNFITQQDNTIQIQSDCGWRNATGPRLRPQTAPRRDLKATKDHSHLRPSLPSTTPPHHSVTKMYIFEYIRILSDSSTHSYFIRFKNLNIFIRTLFVSNFRRNNISCFKAAYK